MERDVKRQQRQLCVSETSPSRPSIEAQPTLPAPVQPQIQGYTAPGTTGTLGTPGMAIGAPVGMTTN